MAKTHYIGKYNSIDEARLAVSTGELSEPYVASVSGEVYYNGEISAFTEVLEVATNTLPYTGLIVGFTAETDASYMMLYVDDYFRFSGTSITGDILVAPIENFSDSAITYVLRADYYYGDKKFDSKSVTITQEACPYILEATFITTADNQTVVTKDSSNTGNVYFVDGSNVPNTEYTYTFANAGTHNVKYGFNSATIPNYTIIGAEFVSVTASTAITTVGNFAMQDCKHMVSAYLPGVTAVNKKGLRFNDNLTTINLENITTFGDNALAWDFSLTSVTFGSGLTSMGYSALQEMHNLQSVTFHPDSQITSIANGMFVNDYALTGVTFPSSVTTHQSSVEYPTFKGCSALTEVTFGENTETLGAGMFSVGNDSLTSITCLATTAPTLGGNDFDSITGNTGTLYVPAGSDYSTWASALGSNWTVIFNTYADCKITTTSDNETVKIGYNYNTLNALSDVLVDGVSVKSGLVDDTYTFGDAGVHIVRYVYTGESATQVTRKVDRLESFSASTEILVLDDNALNMYQASNPSRLTSIYLPKVRTIGYQSITNVPVTDIYAPNVVGLGIKALQFNNNLDPVSVSIDKLQSVGNNAFRQSLIKEAHFGSGLTYYDYNVFNECTSLTSVTFDSATTGLTDMPSVGDYIAVYELVFPDCITGYTQNSMQYAMITGYPNLTSVTFGSGSTTFNGLAFTGCTALTEIKCYATTAPSIQTGAFGDLSNNVGTLYVPAGSDYSTWAAELGSNWTVSDTL